MMNKKNLKMKPVGSEYMEQYNALLRYVFQVTEHELSSIGWQEKEIIRAKFPTMQKADVIGWFDDDNLVSQVAIYPMQVKIFGVTYSMGGLTGVGTYPEYCNMGLMHKLLEQALKDMRKKGQYICYLYPYSIPFYRRKGWELISDKISYEIKDYQLPKNRQVSGDVRRVKTDSVELKKTYERYAAHTHGAILRDELAWNEYWLWDSDDIMAAIYYNEKDEPDGYIIYWIENEIFHINNANDIVCIFFVDRDTGKALLLKQLHKLIERCRNIYHDHVDTRNHNIFCNSIPEIEHIIDHLFFFALNHTFLMADFHDGTQFILCDGILFFVWIYPQ